MDEDDATYRWGDMDTQFGAARDDDTDDDVSGFVREIPLLPTRLPLLFPQPQPNLERPALPGVGAGLVEP